MVTANALLQFFESLSWREQKDNKLFNQDLKEEPAWSISSRHRGSGPSVFPDFNGWEGLENFVQKKDL